MTNSPEQPEYEGRPESSGSSESSEPSENAASEDPAASAQASSDDNAASHVGATPRPERQHAPRADRGVQPSRKDRMKPAELVGLSAVLAIFAGLIVLMATRDVRIAVIALGIGFIVALIMVALVGLSMKPNPEDLRAREDLENPH